MSGLVAPIGPRRPGRRRSSRPTRPRCCAATPSESGDRVAIKFGDRTWTHARVLRGVVPVRGAVPRAAARRRAAPRRGAARQHARLPLRVRRRGADRRARSSASTTPAATSTCCATSQHTHCGLVITEPRHEALLAPIADRLPPVLSSTRFADAGRSGAGARRVARRRARPRTRRRPIPGLEPDVDSIWALIFTSGTSDAPKAVICSQRRLLVTGKRMSMIMDLGARRHRLRVHAAVPLERGAGRVGAVDRHAVRGRPRPAVLRVALAARRPPLRRRRTSTTRASRSRTCSRNPSSADDADNTLRVAFGNEGSPEVVDELLAPLRRRGDRRVRRDRGRRRGEPRRRHAGRRARPRARPRARSSTTTATRRPRAELRRPTAGVRNADECVGEIVNTQGVGPFEGYYNNADATAKTTRFGWYWSGDLGYKDARRLPLLRGPQRRLDPRRRRELPGRPDRGGAAQGARASCSPRSTACPTTRPATR